MPCPQPSCGIAGAIIAALAATFPVGIRSQEPGTQEITIEAERVTDPLQQTGSSNSIRIDDLNGNETPVGEILEKEAGVRVRRYGGTGSQSTISIRGSTANQVDFFIDDIPLNDATYGETNLSDLFTDGLDSIEIHRAGGFGASNIGGAVRMRTAPPATPKGNRIRLYGGSFHTAGGAFQVWRRDESLHYQLSGKHELSDQDFRYRSDAGTPVLNTLDDRDEIRKNAQHRSEFGRFRAGLRLGKTDITVLDDASYRRHGIPGPGSNQTEKTEREHMRNTLGISTDTKGFLIPELRLKSVVYFTEKENRFLDPLQEVSFAEPNSRHRIRQFGINLNPELFFPDHHQILRFRFSGEREILHAERRDRYDKTTEKIPGKFRIASTAQFEDEIFFFNRRLSFLPSVEYRTITDRFNDPDPAPTVTIPPEDRSKRVHKSTNYRFAAQAVPFAEAGLRTLIKLQIYSGSRFPLFVEIFGEGGNVIGNPSLLPERSKTAELSAILQIKKSSIRGEIGVTPFERIVRDMILLVPNSQFSLRPENIDAARVRGGEFRGKLDLYRRLRVCAAYTYQLAINESDVSYLKGKYLPLQPMHDLFGSVSYRMKFWEAGFESDFTGAVFRDRSNDYFQYQEGRWIHSLFLKYAFLGEIDSKNQEGLILGVEVKNLLDHRAQDVIGYPLPGRSVSASLTWNF